MGLTDTKTIKVIVKMGRDTGESQGTISSRVEVFRWLLKNEMNKVDIDGVEQRCWYSTTRDKVYQWDLLAVPNTKESQTSTLYLSQYGVKLEGKDYDEKSDKEFTGVIVRQINWDEVWPRGQAPPIWGLKAICTCVGKKARWRRRNFSGTPWYRILLHCNSKTCWWSLNRGLIILLIL